MNVRLKRARELAGYAVQLTRDEGLPTMLKRGAGFVKRRCFGKRARYLPAKKVLEAQRAEMAGKTAADCGLPTISILTPLYNTPEKYLREFLDSFVNQTAPNGQLCLADASDAEHADVKRIVEEYQTKNQRIVYQKIENKGIAANTNAAAELATGEYLALADHDDILAPHAMYTMGRAIRQLREAGEPDGFLYSDEALFTKKIEKPLVAHFKPDYAPDYLLCCNYICHLAVFRRGLFEQVGGERPECDGSQDHDLFLRLIEQIGGAAHLPQVLYYWRVHAGSTSGGTDAKPYVAAAAKKALTDHLSRTGRTGTVEDGLFPSTYRVKWDIEGDPKVSILIPNKAPAYSVVIFSVLTLTGEELVSEDEAGLVTTGSGAKVCSATGFSCAFSYAALYELSLALQETKPMATATATTNTQFFFISFLFICYLIPFL